MVEQPLRSAMVQATRILETGDVAALGQWCVDFCTTRLSAAGAALVELAGSGHDGWTVTASDAAALRLCQADLYTDPGPCRSCLASGEPATVADLSRPRTGWEHFAGYVRDDGFTWVLARPLRFGCAVIGAMELFGTSPEPPTDDDLELIQALLGFAAVFRFQDQLVQQRGVEVGQLHTALASRVVIEQAKGILAVRHGIDLDQAFTQLRGCARSRRRNIHDLAREVIDGHDIQAYPPRG